MHRQRFEGRTRTNRSVALVDEAAIFNMKAVVRETGLTPDTLRAWERRYGLLRPQRTGGRQRLYSQRDIDTLKWLAARREEGLSISRAVELWREIERKGGDPLSLQTSATPFTVPRDADPSRLKANWVERCLAFDEKGAEQVLVQALASLPLETVCSEVLQRGLNEINDGWYRAEASVQQIYFISELTVRRLEGLLIATPAPIHPERILLGCPLQEEHTLGSLLLALLLRRRGWDVIYLGANLPLERLDSTLDQTAPDLVILSAQQLFTASTLWQTARLVLEMGIPLGYGGRIFNEQPALRGWIAGHFLGEDLIASPALVEKLIWSHPEPLPGWEATPSQREAVENFRLRRPLIEVHIQQALDRLNLPYPYLVTANTYLGRNINAALTFGDMSLLDAEIKWLEGLFVHRHVSTAMLYRYLNLYHEAAERYLDGAGQPVVEWLAQTIGKGR